MVRKVPLYDAGEARERGDRTETVRHAGAEAWRPGHTADGPYTFGHTTIGVDVAIWRMEEEGSGLTIGIPREMDGEIANVMAREHGGD